MGRLWDSRYVIMVASEGDVEKGVIMNTIGFVTNTGEKLYSTQQEGTAATASKAVKSLVKVAFQNGQKFTYYNDMFDLKVGDIVFVEGSNEGQRGRVISLNKTFKIKLSDYKKVVSVADRSVKGRLFLGGSHLVSFEKETLPYEKVLSWMKAPEPDENEFVCVKDDESQTFPLDDLKQMKIPMKIAERGFDYYENNQVSYVELDGTRGRAIVDGTRAYEVEFNYEDGIISGLFCDCPHMDSHCKHEFAVLLQLKETLELIKERYPEELGNRPYFAAVSHGLFLSVVIDGKQKGSFVAEF